jgi:hypothetical protein
MLFYQSIISANIQHNENFTSAGDQNLHGIGANFYCSDFKGVKIYSYPSTVRKREVI